MKNKLEIKLRKLPFSEQYNIIEVSGNEYNYGMSVYDNDSIVKVAHRFIEFGNMILKDRMEVAAKKKAEYNHIDATLHDLTRHT